MLLKTMLVLVLALASSFVSAQGGQCSVGQSKVVAESITKVSGERVIIVNPAMYLGQRLAVFQTHSSLDVAKGICKLAGYSTGNLAEWVYRSNGTTIVVDEEGGVRDVNEIEVNEPIVFAVICW